MKKVGKKPVKRRRGRPSNFTPELSATICRRLADGESLRAICREEGVPDKETIRRWLEDKPDFRAQYARARQEQGHSLIDEAMDEARACKDSQTASAARVKVDCLFRAAAKLHPKVYGDNATVKHTGADGGDIKAVVKQVFDFEQFSKDFDEFYGGAGKRRGGVAEANGN